MDIIKIKKRLAALQEDGCWNDGLNFIMNCYEFEHSCELLTLIISEIFWLITDDTFYANHPRLKPKGYDDINWEFKQRMGYYVDNGKRLYKEEVLFQWLYYYHLSIDCYPFFYCSSDFPYEKEMKDAREQALTLSEGTTINRIVALTTGRLDDNPEGFDRMELLHQIDLLKLQKNHADCCLSYQLTGYVDSKARELIKRANDGSR